RFVKLTNGTWQPQYYYTDHRGDIRVVYRPNPTTGTAEVVQEDHLTPFGVQMVGLGRTSWPDNQYHYQGKELNTTGFDTDGDAVIDSRLYQYDFHARQYDPLIGRWHSPDPMLQYSSPYLAMGNDWINIIDPYGMEGEPWWKRLFKALKEFFGDDGSNSSTAEKYDNVKGNLQSSYEETFFGGELLCPDIISSHVITLNNSGGPLGGEMGWWSNSLNIVIPEASEPDYGDDPHNDAVNPMPSKEATSINYQQNHNLVQHYDTYNNQSTDASGREGDDMWGFGTYMGGTFAPVVGPTAEVGFIVDSKGQAYNYLSFGIAVGVEVSAGAGVIVVPQKNFKAKDWSGDGSGFAINIPFTPVAFEYTQSMYNTNYRAGKTALGIGFGGSMNWSYTIMTPVVPPELWSRPGQPR
ncbi:MAG: hypothetical protein CVU06_11580, partial [Bacteroidetes bacterium HGW-Bacteroidetes-22]